MFSFLISCQLFDKKVPDENTLLQEELQKINWNQVDEYPSILSCDSLPDLDAQKQCFFETISQEIKQKINADSLAKTYKKLDTIYFKVTVYPDKVAQIQVEKLSDTTKINVQKLNVNLHNKLKTFSPIEPATKRGVKVKTQFVLPITIQK